MRPIAERFVRLATDHAPGQEVRRGESAATPLRGDVLPGVAVDFSHGDVNADAFPPAPGALAAFLDGEQRGTAQAYTEYRGDRAQRELAAGKLGAFTGSGVSAEGLIITPGTQGALFLAMATTVNPGDRVAIVRPDYFANRKLVEFLGGHAVPITLDYMLQGEGAGLDLDQLADAFQAGARTFLFSNPNNPTGVVYSARELSQIAELANVHGVTVIVDQLYSRLVYSGGAYTHLCASGIATDQLLTIMGPSKTESLSGYRLGVAFGAPHLIDRAERLQAIVSLRAPGYSQAVLSTWFEEPTGWLQDRTARHQAIRDDLVAAFRNIDGAFVRVPDAGSYIFPRLPSLDISVAEFVDALRIQAGVVVTPGTEFSPDASESVRLNFSQHRQHAVHAVQRIAELTDRYRTIAR